MQRNQEVFLCLYMLLSRCESWTLYCRQTGSIAANMMGVKTLSQRKLDNMTTTARKTNTWPVLHCAGNDSNITLRISR
jgi:predicted amidohydrolase YtcJ